MRKTAHVVLAFVTGLLVGAGAHSSAFLQSGAQANRESVTGIGGVFFKARDPDRLRAWYREHLGLEGDSGPGVNFFWREDANPARFGLTVWSVFPEDTSYFGDGQQRFMVNYRVRDLDALLARLRAQGVEQVGGVEDYWYGRFAWVLDGEGNRVELWQPVSYSPEEFERQRRREESR